jgi:hypothetical protein
MASLEVKYDDILEKYDNLRALANSKETGPLVELFNAKFKLAWPRPRQGEEGKSLRCSLDDRKDDLWEHLDYRAHTALQAMSRIGIGIDTEPKVTISKVKMALVEKLDSMDKHGVCVDYHDTAANAIAELWLMGMLLIAVTVVFGFPDIDGAGYPRREDEGANEDDDEKNERFDKNEDREAMCCEEMTGWITVFNRINVRINTGVDFNIESISNVVFDKYELTRPQCP